MRDPSDPADEQRTENFHVLIREIVWKAGAEDLRAKRWAIDVRVKEMNSGN
jgi:hypothetical protein